MIYGRLDGIELLRAIVVILRLCKMAKKHQIVVSSKRGRSRAGRKWRRQAKERLTVSIPKYLGTSFPKKRPKNTKPMKPQCYPNAFSGSTVIRDLFGDSLDRTIK